MIPMVKMAENKLFSMIYRITNLPFKRNTRVITQSIQFEGKSRPKPSVETNLLARLFRCRITFYLIAVVPVSKIKGWKREVPSEELIDMPNGYYIPI